MKINITSKIYNKPLNITSKIYKKQPIDPRNYDWENVETLNARTDSPNQIRRFGY
jgi:hypothetical protein